MLIILMFKLKIKHLCFYWLKPFILFLQTTVVIQLNDAQTLKGNIEWQVTGPFFL